MSTTKPGSLLKGSIPIRTFAEWNEDRPGFIEVDLVAHCGESTNEYRKRALRAATRGAAQLGYRLVPYPMHRTSLTLL